MKVLILIIAIYALIFNQASKQGELKASQEVNQVKKELQSAENIYLHHSDIPAQSPLYHITDRIIQRESSNYIFQPAVMKADLKQQLFYPNYYPNTVNLHNKKS